MRNINRKERQEGTKVTKHFELQMNTDNIIPKLESEWDIPEGFFYKARQGKFDMIGYQRVKELLKSIHLEPNEKLERRFVSLVWFIPIFMEWQTERISEQLDDNIEYIKATNELTGLTEDILGIP